MEENVETDEFELGDRARQVVIISRQRIINQDWRGAAQEREEERLGEGWDIRGDMAV